ncbi:MAG: hypothetical protein AABZ53_07565 [Planctomycetota bacterium]
MHYGPSKAWMLRFNRELPFITSEVNPEIDQPYHIFLGSPSDTTRLAQYYLDHQEFDSLGREMLVQGIFYSFRDAILNRLVTDEMHATMRMVIARASKDPFVRDEISSELRLRVEAPEESWQVGDWIALNFPQLKPQPSIWSKSQAEIDLALKRERRRVGP